MYAAAHATLARQLPAHEATFAIPMPLSEEERAALDPEADPAAVALERAIERGRHLVQSRYGCTECHGADFAGGVMIDDPMIGRLLGPNLTKGGVTRDYTPQDWDRAVRHGILADGTVSAMPSMDYLRMSDQELGDIVAYIESFPARPAVVSRPELGPLGAFLIATGELPLSVDEIPDHFAEHALRPPQAEVSVTFGEHLAGICTGCHRSDFRGGPIAAGDPSWPPASNLTPHEDGLAGWSFDDFRAAMLDLERPDGSAVGAPMDMMQPFVAQMTEVELEALWTYLASVEPVPLP